MTRPRIRTIKPECWQDEKVGGLTRDARLLWVGLITLADDEGRFRAMPSLIIGHALPYDDDAHRKLPQWERELESAGLVQFYEVDNVRYGAIPHWHDHQKVNRPNPSKLPAPSANGHGNVTPLPRSSA